MEPDNREKRAAPSRVRVLMPWAGLAGIFAVSVLVLIPALRARWESFGVRLGAPTVATLDGVDWLRGDSPESPWRDLRGVRRVGKAAAVAFGLIAALAVPILASRHARARRVLMLIGWVLAGGVVAWLGVVIVPAELVIVQSVQTPFP